MNEKQKPLSRWTRAQMIGFIEEHTEKLRVVRDEYEQILQAKYAMHRENARVELQKMHKEASSAWQQIKAIHDKIYVGGEETASLRDAVNEFVSGLQENAEKFEKAKKDILGYTKTGGDGQAEVVPGYLKEIRKKLTECERKYNLLHGKTGDLRDEIQTALNASVTTIGLFNAFNEKAVEYTDIRRYLEWGIIGLLAAGISTAVLFPTVLFPESLPADGGFETFLALFPHAFIVSLFTWLVIFLGNRRAENKKLEEVYKHKAAMAKSYIGYEEYITNLGPRGKTLLPTLMQNLLDAIKQDPSVFLKVKGEGHPAADFFRPSRPE